MASTVKRFWRWTAAVVGLVIVLGIGAALVVIGPRDLWGMLRYDQRQEGALVVGARAPDVVLSALDGSTRVHLGERFGKRPVVLVFGSYT